MLREKGILYAPDFVINSGGLINVANELEGYNQERAKRNVDMVRHILGRVFDVADAEDIPTFQAANRVAERRIESMSDLKDFWLNPDLPRRIEARAQNRP